MTRPRRVPEWFRENVWSQALAAAEINRRLTFHGRHSHATWLARGGEISVRS
jgi:integrase